MFSKTIAKNILYGKIKVNLAAKTIKNSGCIQSIC
jgi:hypothetical protein